MREPELSSRRATPDLGSGGTTIPIVEEQAHILKRSAETERVSVRTTPEEEQVVLRDTVSREHVDVTRVAMDREVAELPQTRTEGDITIIPVVEERLVVEKRLFLVEELHLRRSTRSEPVELATSLRRTRVDIVREDLTQEEDR